MSLRLPLFPLNTVLFPGMEIPLHVFEARYREMIALCLREHTPFGVVLIKSGSEVGGPAVPYEVGTLARIASAERMDDGRYNIRVRGGQRFRIESLDRKRAYLVGAVSLLVEEDGAASPEELRALAGRVGALYVEHSRLLLAIADQWSKRIALPDAPAAAAYFVAGKAELPNAQRQAVLEVGTTRERLELLDGYLAEELQRLKAQLRAHLQQKFGGLGTSN